MICDADRMIQVIGNIVDNALKFSPQNSTIRVEVSHNHASSVPPPPFRCRTAGMEFRTITKRRCF